MISTRFLGAAIQEEGKEKAPRGKKEHQDARRKADGTGEGLKTATPAACNVIKQKLTQRLVLKVRVRKLSL